MSSDPIDPGKRTSLRHRAHIRLSGNAGQESAVASAATALGVLHELASSPSTAGDALALLHELQVHQIELDLQAEELRGTRSELEAALIRQIQLYDFAPVGAFTVDGSTTMHELNLTGARMLGAERDALVGQALDSYLTVPGSLALHALLASVSENLSNVQSCQFELAAHAGVAPGQPKLVQASARVDPAGPFFLLAFFA